jgi:hypothetical protein
MAILVMLYFMLTSAIFRPTRRGRRSKPENRPWLEEHRILSSDKIVELPDPPKPVLEETISLEAKVSREGESRGMLMIEIETNGSVSSRWFCEYTQGDTYYVYSASSEGNIDVTKTFIEDGKEDLSKLFFITKGTFEKTIQKESEPAEKVLTESGTLYVIGYLGTDYTASGQITITTDNTWSAAYEFAAK